MQVPLEIACTDFKLTDPLRTLIHDLAEGLEGLCDDITSCRVTIEQPQKHQESGNEFQVRLETHIPPGHDLVVKRRTGQNEMHQELFTLVHDAFATMENQIKKTTEMQRGAVKRHPENEINGFVSKTFPDEGYGFIESMDGREVYFHQNSVLHDDFDRLAVGTGIHYVGESGSDGPQASTVKIVDKPGARIESDSAR